MPGRVMRLVLSGTVTGLLSVAMVSAVLGQSQEPIDPMGATAWTGTWTFDEASFSPGTSSSTGDSTVYSGIAYQGAVEADDPRVSGTMTVVQNGRTAASQDPVEGDLGLASAAVRIDNDEGAWVGSLSSFSSASGGEEWYVLEGEGAYDGQSTIFRWHEDGFAGVILPTELPTMPDAIAPPTE